MFAPLHVLAAANDAPSTSALLVSVKAPVAPSVVASLPASPLVPDDDVPEDELVPDDDDDEVVPEDPDEVSPLVDPLLLADDAVSGVDSDEQPASAISVAVEAESNDERKEKIACFIAEDAITAPARRAGAPQRTGGCSSLSSTVWLALRLRPEPSTRRTRCLSALGALQACPRRASPALGGPSTA